MEKSYLQKIIPFIDNMRIGQEEGGDEPTPTPSLIPLVDGAEIDNNTLFKLLRDEDVLLEVLKSLDYQDMGEEPGESGMAMLWTFDGYPGLYAIYGPSETFDPSTGKQKTGYILGNDTEMDKGGLLFASEPVDFGTGEIIQKGFYNLDDNDCFEFHNGERTITLGDQADKWNGIIVGQGE